MPVFQQRGQRRQGWQQQHTRRIRSPGRSSGGEGEPAEGGGWAAPPLPPCIGRGGGPGGGDGGVRRKTQFIP